MKFSKQFLLELLEDDSDKRIVVDEIVDKLRWSVYYRQIFKHEGKFYETRYFRGATECQDDRPYQYAGDEIECPEVIPVEKTVIVYERTKV